MSEHDDILNALPKVEPSRGFEDQLFADALKFMPKNDMPSAPSGEPSSYKKSTPYWAAFAIAASMAFGVWIGMGDLAFTQDSLMGLGASASVEVDDALEFDIYGDAFSSLSS